MTVAESVRREALEFRGAHGDKLIGDRWASPRRNRGTVLLLHGGGQTRHSWERTARRLAGAGWHAITMDARGHGDSEWSQAGYTLDFFVADLHATIAQIGTAPVVVGASLGGRTALAAVGERPGSVSGLVLVDIAHRVDPDGRERVRDFMAGAPKGFASLEDVAAAVDAYRPAPRRRRNLDGLRKNLRQRADGRWYWHWDPRFLEFTTNGANFDVDRLSRAARKITVPTLLVRGKKSDMVTAEAAAEIRDLVPTAEVVEVGAGHMVAGDDNDVFTAHLQQFLTGRVGEQVVDS